MVKLRTCVSPLATVCLILTMACATVAEGRYSGSFAQGVSQFYAGDFGGASKSFEIAEAENPGNHAAYLWHGLALTGMGDADKAANIWLKMPWDINHKSMTRYFLGLAYWRAGETSNAKYWLKENDSYKETPAYALSQAALVSLLRDGEVPPFSDWATMARLPGAKGTPSAQVGGTVAQTAEPARPLTPPKESTNTAAFAGASPSGGLWKGTISNGYKGQTIGFRVSADGRTITDVIFHGYFSRRGGGIESTDLAPLRDVPIKGGSFDDTQLNGGALVRFDFTGTFTSPTTAEGTYRVMSDTSYDTYKLNWTARRVGN